MSAGWSLPVGHGKREFFKKIKEIWIALRVRIEIYI
jgi:hypothetical protein